MNPLVKWSPISDRITYRVALKKRTADSFGVISGQPGIVCVSKLHSQSVFDHPDVLIQFDVFRSWWSVDVENHSWLALENCRILHQSTAVGEQVLRPPSHLWCHGAGHARALFGRDETVFFNTSHLRGLSKPKPRSGIDGTFGLPRYDDDSKTRTGLPRYDDESLPPLSSFGLIFARFEPGIDPNFLVERDEAWFWSCDVFLGHCQSPVWDRILNQPVAYKHHTVYVPRVNSACCEACQNYVLKIPNTKSDQRAVLLESWECGIRYRLHPSLHPRAPQTLDSVFAQKCPGFDSDSLQRLILDFVATPRTLVFPTKKKSGALAVSDEISSDIKMLFDGANLYGADLIDVYGEKLNPPLWPWRFGSCTPTPRLPHAVVITSLSHWHKMAQESALQKVLIDDHISKGGLLIVFPGTIGDLRTASRIGDCQKHPCRLCRKFFEDKSTLSFAHSNEKLQLNEMFRSMLPEIFPFLQSRPGWESIERLTSNPEPLRVPDSGTLSVSQIIPQRPEGRSAVELNKAFLMYDFHVRPGNEKVRTSAAVLADEVPAEERIIDVVTTAGDGTTRSRPFVTVARHGRGHLVYIGDSISFVSAQIVRLVIDALARRGADF